MVRAKEILHCGWPNGLILAEIALSPQNDQDVQIIYHILILDNALLLMLQRRKLWWLVMFVANLTNCKICVILCGLILFYLGLFVYR